MNSDSFKYNVTYKIFTYSLFLSLSLYIYNLTLNVAQVLICYKTQPNINLITVNNIVLLTVLIILRKLLLKSF